MKNISNKELQSTIDDHIQSRNFNGSVLVGKKGQVLLSKGYGMANFEHDIPNTSTTKYRVGSISKQFTSTSILLLEERELLHVGDAISKYIPDFPNGDAITIHHLLTHTSGIPNFNRIPDFTDIKGNYSSLVSTIDRFKHKPLEFTPGTKFNYCNSGYILLAHIIELITGDSYDHFLDNNIFLPLHMQNSGLDDYKTVLKNRASGYEIVDNQMKNSEFIHMSIPKGAGSIFSTVEDLYLWVQSLITDKILNKSSLEKLFTSYLDNYGFAWYIDQISIKNKLRKRIHHSGGIFGFQNQLHRYADDDIVIILSSNIGTSDIYPLSVELASYLFEE